MFLQPTNFLPSGYLRGGPHNHVHLGTGVPMSRDLGSSTKIAVSVPLAATVYIQWRFQSCQATRTARAVYICKMMVSTTETQRKYQAK